MHPTLSNPTAIPLNEPAEPPRRFGFGILLDVLLILAISFVAEATYFSGQQGRALLCGDSAQYVAQAEALLDPNQSPHFEMRKPGYIFYLAVVKALFGNLGWAAVTGNHVLLGLLPLAAYGLGLFLHSRWLGWLGAIVLIARLQTVVWGNRMLSEPLFTCVLSFGLMCFAAGMNRRRNRLWLISAGTLFGLAWFTRGTAAPIILAAIVAGIVTFRHTPRRAIAGCSYLTAPILAFVIFECGLNLAYAGVFRPSNGTSGMMLLMRVRYFDGADWPDHPDVARLVELLPERTRQTAYKAAELDQWVARYRAIHEQGMSEYEIDDLARRVAIATLGHAWPQYVLSTAKLTAVHLLRYPNGDRFSPLPPEARGDPIMPPDAADAAADWGTQWFAYYGTPHLSPDQSVRLFERMQAAASTRAPFAGGDPWRSLRYWKTRPAVAGTLDALQRLGAYWPGLALIAFPLLGLNRRVCGFLALAFIMEAVFVSLLWPTSDRHQFIWIAADTALAAALPVGLLAVVVRRVQLRVKPAIDRRRLEALRTRLSRS